ncbi:YbaL family putative K(+) efflux transporter [Hyphomicrobium sp. MC1]|uniref:YbaL family putative K(+) efflux transporter n=1 Tax=Hyphomicrobium sp. (strain MC1) TaxID=717785 RepID=UPI000213E164|nr:YbaL family putative K(+) efflux transporter [Hyphomicrobium sp. MC1]CCB64571.1 putative monovalent cation:proton antiporter (CPA2 family) ybaL [Hyphomicrobium sp. MC1]
MAHDTPLIATIVVGLSLAFIFGAIAQRFRISPIVGYLLAGVAVGPFTPGFVADQGLANELAEIGIILLMFGVGLHFSMSELLAVRAIAVPGALVQIAVATAMGVGLATTFGWSLGAGLVFGLALSVASTVVLLRALQERRLVKSDQGRIAVGWLIVEDLVMVLTLVILPAVAPLLSTESANAAGAHSPNELAMTLAVTLLKVAAFVAVMLLGGRKLIPAILHHIAHTGSRELFRLGVLTIALGVAFAAANLFGVSLALGAFFAGMILSESELSQRAANETLPLRDAFAVLFFVSVGMLFYPNIIVENPLRVVAVIAIIIVGKSLAAWLIVLAFGHGMRTALLIAASLAQIGEFSFILAGLGVTLKLLPVEGRELILAGALLSIMLNPLLFLAVERYGPAIAAEPPKPKEPAPAGPAPGQVPLAAKPASELEHVTSKTGHTVLVGFGRVGSLIGESLIQRGTPLFVMDDRDDTAQTLKARGLDAVAANAVTDLASANLKDARALIVAIPDCFEAGQIVAQGRAANPGLQIIARAHSDAEEAYLKQYGASDVVQGSRETAGAMIVALDTPSPAPIVDPDPASKPDNPPDAA